MFNWFRRSAGKPAVKQARAASRPRTSAPPESAAAPGVPAPAALPEVVAEGNTQADWSAWEDSMTALDSQMQGLSPSERFHVRETRPSQLDEHDPFSTVGRKRDV